MKPKFLLLPVVIIFIIINSCTESITDPEPEPGRRDYVWTADTLNMPMNFATSIWGSSPDDVWAVGPGGDDDNRLFHYDGINWTAYTKEQIICTGQVLYGFTKNNVWMGGDTDGRIWHYDGTTWSENYRHIIPDAYNVSIYDIYGTNQNDVYACGIISYVIDGISQCRGFVLQYNGHTWTEVTRANFNSQFITLKKEKEKIFIYAFKTSEVNVDTVAYYELRGNNLVELISKPLSIERLGNIHIIDGKVYFLFGKDVYRYINENFEKQFSLTHENFGSQFYGRSVNDIFVRMNDGLAHYNGIDIQYLYTFPKYSISIVREPVLFENEVFFNFWPNIGKTIILKGRLN